LQRQCAGGAHTGGEIAAIPHSVHEALEKPGRPLDAASQAFMESRFDRDFSGVRLHTDAEAAGSARDVDARAYTAGDHIAFGAGEYSPHTAAGQRLLVHEMAHVAQNGTGRQRDVVSRPGDATEVDADRATDAVFSGRTPQSTGSGAALARQFAGSSPTAAPTLSQGELVESFLKRMWASQSGQQDAFRVTAKVLEGLNYVFPFGAPVGPLTIFKSPDELMARLRPSIPSTIDPKVMAVLDRLPGQEKKLSDKPNPSTDPAAPNMPDAPGAPKQPEKPKDASDAAEAALKAAYEQFSKTELGKQLEKSVKSYVLSLEGIPLDVIVAQGVLMFVAANDPKLPSSPDIPIGDGIKIKIEISGRASDLPPLVRDLVRGHSTQPMQPGQDEKKIGVSVTVTDDEFVAMAKAVGHFFAVAAGWIAKGVVKAGTVIGKAAASIKFELIGALAGAGAGALIGGLAGGGLGAAIGAGIGALAGLGAGIAAHLLSKKKEPAQ
jgi:hypothetical protein